LTCPRIESLLQIMQTFDAWGVAKLLCHIDEVKGNIAKLTAIAEDTMEPQAIELYISSIVYMALHHATVAKLQSTYDRVWEGGGPFWMAMKTGQLTYGQAEHELVFLRQCIEADLEKRLFAFIDPQRAHLFGAMDNNWGAIITQVPDSKADVEDAHISYMVELYTSTVFHMMRAAEHGLRILAKKLRVTSALKHKGHIIPIDHAEWQKIIDAINNKLNKLKLLAAGPKRTAQLEKFSDAGQHCLFMKDIWRNTVSHARKPYNESEAKAALDRVHGFMQFVVKEFAQ
jgi:hypothetical protein